MLLIDNLLLLQSSSPISPRSNCALPFKAISGQRVTLAYCDSGKWQFLGADLARSLASPGFGDTSLLRHIILTPHYHHHYFLQLDFRSETAPVNHSSCRPPPEAARPGRSKPNGCASAAGVGSNSSCCIGTGVSEWIDAILHHHTHAFLLSGCSDNFFWVYLQGAARRRCSRRSSGSAMERQRMRRQNFPGCAQRKKTYIFRSAVRYTRLVYGIECDAPSAPSKHRWIFWCSASWRQGQQ